MAHKYKVEVDVIEDAGEDAIKKLATDGNVVYLDFKTLESEADNEKNKKKYEIGKTLELFTSENLDSNNKCFNLNSGGSVSWDDPKNDNIIHITRNKGLKSKLLREGKKVDFPQFLCYGPENLKEGIKKIEYCEDLENITPEIISEIIGNDLFNNQFLNINSQNKILQLMHQLISNNEKTRFSINEDQDIYLNDINQNKIGHSTLKGFEPRDLEQKLAYEVLINRDIEVVVISGGSGSGKTVVPYVTAIESILGTTNQRKEHEIYENIILFKTNDIIGGKDREHGFFPGELHNKTINYMKSYIDAHNLCGIKEQLNISFEDLLADPRDSEFEHGKRDESKNKLHDDSGYLPAYCPGIEIEHLQYARGRTFENKYIIIDEAQNYTPFEMKQLLERVGQYSKVVIIGDHEQVDNPRLSSDFNGLVFAANHLWGTHPRMAMVHFDKNYRSQTAEIMRGIRAPNS